MMAILSFVWIDADWLNSYVSSGKGKAIIIDVRTPEEHEMGFIPGTHYLIPHTIIGEKIKELKINPEKDTIIVYCRSGNRSTIAAKVLESKGYKNVLNLKGGIREWQKKGYKVVQGQKTGR
jgi:hydroxyacylglutathione hydrolase